MQIVHSIFRRLIGLFGTNAAAAPKQTQPQPQPAEVTPRFRINPYSFGAGGYVLDSTEHELYRFLCSFYTKNGVVPMTIDEIIYKGTGGTSTLSVAIEEQALEAVNELLEPKRAFHPLLKREGDKIIPSDRFGLLKVH